MSRIDPCLRRELFNRLEGREGCFDSALLKCGSALELKPLKRSFPLRQLFHAVESQLTIELRLFQPGRLSIFSLNGVRTNECRDAERHRTGACSERAHVA
jgi:hypothetical protein